MRKGIKDTVDLLALVTLFSAAAIAPAMFFGDLYGLNEKMLYFAVALPLSGLIGYGRGVEGAYAFSFTDRSNDRG